MLKESKNQLQIDISEILNLISNTNPSRTKVEAIEYRLYYDKDGKVVSYSTEELWDCQYVVISKEQYLEARQDVIIKDGEIVLTHKQSHVFKYSFSEDFDVLTSVYDVNIVTKSIKKSNKWKFTAYEL